MTTYRQWTVRTRELGTGLASTASSRNFYLLVPAVGTLVDASPNAGDSVFGSIPTGGRIFDAAPSMLEFVESEIPQSGVIFDSTPKSRDFVKVVLPVRAAIYDVSASSRDVASARVGTLPPPGGPPTTILGRRSSRGGRPKVGDHVFDAPSLAVQNKSQN